MFVNERIACSFDAVISVDFCDHSASVSRCRLFVQLLEGARAASGLDVLQRQPRLLLLIPHGKGSQDNSALDRRRCEH